MNLDEELLKDAEDDQLTIEFIKRYLPQEVKEKFTEEDLYYFLDVLVEYYATSGILDADPDADGYIDIDIDTLSIEDPKTYQLPGKAGKERQDGRI